jgi:hypothetical protein
VFVAVVMVEIKLGEYCDVVELIPEIVMLYGVTSSNLGSWATIVEMLVWESYYLYLE